MLCPTRRRVRAVPTLDSVLPDDDLGADVHPAIEIDHVVIDQPEAAGRDGLTVIVNTLTPNGRIPTVAELSKFME
jgi:hypothetical protein